MKQFRNIMLVLLYILGLVLLTFLPACNKDGFLEQKHDVVLSIDTRLPKDSNGYSVFKLYSTQSQNIHTISGTIRVNGIIPDNPREKVEWENNLYWNINKGDTVATITKTYLNEYTNQFVVVKLPPLISNISALVPTINSACYNSADGTINTVIAPVYNMKGDTMVVVVKCGDVKKIEKIILK